MKIFVTVLTLAVVFATSEAGPQGRITYGRFADAREFPFYVGMSKYPGNRADVYCGGAVISNYWVITAAHCVENMTAITLHLGSTNFFTPELTLTITENYITKHPDFNINSYNNDIALINTTYIGYTRKINKVYLPSMRDTSNVSHRIVTVMGWGEDGNGVHDPYHLKTVYLRLMTPEACQPLSVEHRFNNEKTLCAMTDIGSICYGDSGGPVVMSENMLLVGISSFLTNSCARAAPVGIVRVTEYLDWIKSVSGVYRD